MFCLGIAADYPKRPRQRKSKQSLNLRFTPGYKGDFKVDRVAFGIGDLTIDDVDGFVDEFSTFDEFKRPFVAFDFAKPTDIIPAFSLEKDVPKDIFTEQDHNFPVAVDSFGQTGSYMTSSPSPPQLANIETASKPVSNNTK